MDKFGDDYTVLHKYDPQYVDDFKIEIYSVGIYEENKNFSCFTQVNTGIIIRKGKEVYFHGLKYKRVTEHVFDIQQKLLSEALGIR